MKEKNNQLRGLSIVFDNRSVAIDRHHFFYTICYAVNTPKQKSVQKFKFIVKQNTLSVPVCDYLRAVL